MLIPMSHLTEHYQVRPSGILHLGANVAEEAADYDHAGVKKVLWVECHPGAFQALEAAIKPYPGHRVVFRAVSNTDDHEVSFHKTSNGMSSSLLPMLKHREKHPEVTPAGVITVKTITVDTMFERAGLIPADYDFANLDLQGAELLALRGMEKYLKSCRWVYIEINTEELYDGCALFPEVDRFLTKRGFRLLEKKLWSEFHAWGDALYAR